MAGEKANGKGLFAGITMFTRLGVQRRMISTVLVRLMLTKKQWCLPRCNLFSLVAALVLFSPFTVFAVSAPAVEIASSSSSAVTFAVSSSEAVDGFNLYVDRQYLSTHREPRITLSGPANGDYCVVAFQQRQSGISYSQCSAEVSVDLDGQQSAGQVAMLRADVYSATAAELFWQPGSGSTPVAFHEIYRDGVLVATREGVSYFDASLESGREYRFDVVALDQNGGRSLPVSLLLQAIAGNSYGASSSAPTPPVDQPASDNSVGVARELRFDFYSATVGEVFWDAAETPGGVRLYELTRDGQVVSTTTGRSFFEPVLNAGQTYRYELVTVDNSGGRSPPLVLSVNSNVGDTVSVGAGDPGTVDDLPPVGASQEADDFYLQLGDGPFDLREGAGNTLRVPFFLHRRNNHSDTVTLTIQALDDTAGSQAEVSFEPAQFDGNATLSASDVVMRLPVAAKPLEGQQRRYRLVASDQSQSSSYDFSVQVIPFDGPDVYLLAGQSNMVGYSELNQKFAFAGGIDEPDSRIRQLNVTSNNLSFYSYPGAFTDVNLIAGWPRLIRAEDPMHETLFPGATSRGGTFVGPGLTFAKAALADNGRSIVLVPTAWSATGFCANDLGQNMSWNASTPDSGAFGGTALADRAMARLNLALQESGGVLRGILWHQGEADSNAPECASRYAENLRQLVQRIRTEARLDARGSGARQSTSDVPFIVGTMSRGADSRGSYTWFGSIKDQVDSVHRGIASIVPHSDFVNNDDLVPPAFPCGTGDCVHFGAAAYREMGRRYFDALKRIWR